MQKQTNEAIAVNRQKTMKLAKMGMLVAISILLVNIHFPIFGPVAFLEYDPADIPILIGGFAFGPLAGVCITIVTAILQGLTVSAQSGLYGILMHIVATSTLVLVSSTIYKMKKNRKMAVLGLLCGTLAMTAIMIPANYLITPYFMNVPKQAITGILPFIVGFNLIKAGVNSVSRLSCIKKYRSFCISFNLSYETEYGYRL